MTFERDGPGDKICGGGLPNCTMFEPVWYSSTENPVIWIVGRFQKNDADNQVIRQILELCVIFTILHFIIDY